MSCEAERDAWIIDAAHPLIDSMIRTSGYDSSGSSGPDTLRYYIDLTNAKKRKTLRKRMKKVLSHLTIDASHSIV